MEFDLSKCIGFVTDTAIKTITENFNQRLERLGSTRIQWIALYFLDCTEKAINQKDLAALMNVQDSTMARLVDRMERDGLIKRIEDPNDRRIKLLELTHNGKAKIDELMPAGIDFSNLLLKDISPEELEIFECVLSKMINNIKE
ncbi:MAG: MarR family winged helix-turn-helix transcriptional regulator [Anaerovoracaceae bacterium]|jgi:DNA-binding MarR family transcriptional regulator